jgi:uncharacterized protein DUF4953/uncharacterized protein DUF5117
LRSSSRGARYLRAAALCLALAVLGPGLEPGAAAQQPAPTAPAPAPTAAAPAPTAAPTPDPYQEAIRDATPYKGLLTLYEKQGRLLCELQPAQLDHVFLMFPAIKEGIAQGWIVSGLLYWDQHWTVGFHRVGQKIQFVRFNTRFLSSEDRQLATLVKEGYGDSVLAALDIVAENTGAGTVLVDLGPAFFQDLGDVGSTLSAQTGVPFHPDPSRVAWGTVKAFPRNVELDVRLVFASEQSFEMNTVPDSRSVPVTMRYSLVEPPDPSLFRPRLLDDRVGYYYSAVRDLSMPGSEEPFERYLHRWPLEKANPELERSAAKQPIIYYLEKSIPYRFRPAVRRGILEWNKAFEKIGIVDAIEVRFQPDDADWDAEDVRYATIRWSAGAAFAGIGPVRVDPRTGQIVDADILIDADIPRHYMQFSRLYGIGTEPALDSLSLTLGSPRTQDPARRPPAVYCPLAAGLAGQIDLGVTVLEQGGQAGGGSLDAFLDAAIKWYVMHEVGHTLGLRHNFKGTAATPLSRLNDRAWTSEHGLSGSVMDYPGVNLAPPGAEQGEYFPSTLGPWDEWAIEYGYKPIPQTATPRDELPELRKIAARSADPSLAYASDEDLGTWAYEDADAYTNIWDLSADPLEWSIQRLALVRSLLGSGLEDRVVADGERFQRLRRAVATLFSEYARSMWYASRMVGGYDVTRIHKGEPPDASYLRPVPLEKQVQALGFLAETGFDDRWLEGLPPHLLSNLAPETWAHWGMPPAGQNTILPVQAYVLLLRAIVLDRLLSGPVMLRLQNAEMAAPAGTRTLSEAELFAFLHSAVWPEVGAGKENSAGAAAISRFRRDLQRYHLDRLIALANAPAPGALQDVTNLARADLTELSSQIGATLQSQASKLDRTSLAHLEECQARIQRALEAAYELHLR